VQCVVHAVEVVEDTGHRRDLDDLSFIVVLPEALEQVIADVFGRDRQRPRVL
jgi:hypothetical protein